MSAAPIPTTMNGTPRRLRAANNARSAGVSAKRSTTEASAKTLGRRQLETPKRVIDVTSIDIGVGSRDLVRTPPQRLRSQRPRPLLVGPVVRFAQHAAIMPAARPDRCGFGCDSAARLRRRADSG
jgi:hypothetical protein